jgi:protein-S-isoprenylcysteine O-methyltransferase Ste14
VRPIAYEVPSASVVFAGLLVVYAVVEVAIRIMSVRNAAGSRPREVTSLIVIVVVLGASLGGALLIAGRVPGTAIPLGREVLYVTGVVVIALGIALRVWAVVVLGRSFTVEVRVREGQQVVDRGPYRVVRHPSYTGLLAVFLGTGLALDNWLALLVVVIPPVAAIAYRIRVEERALLAGIGEPYRRYAAGRKRLIPGIW